MRFLFNEDGNHFIYSRKSADENVSVNELKEFMLQYKGTQITDFLFNVNGRISSVPSEVMEDVIDLYERAAEQGRTNEHLGGIYVAYDLFINQKVDMYQIWFEAAKDMGIRPWLSFRMNDCHNSFSTDTTLVPEFYLQHPNLKRVTYRPAVSSADNCYDYSFDAIRKIMEDYIREMLVRYDAYGIELDFMREMTCFQPGFERANAHIMTDFVSRVKGIAREAEKRRGHKVEISVTMPVSPETAYNIGFNVREWAENGYIDIVTVISRWATICNDIPIGFWKEMLKDYGVAVFAGHQILLRSCPGAPLSINSFETAVGSSAAYYYEGADGAYLYNYMDRIGPFLCDGTQLKTDLQDPERLRELLCTIGDKEKVMSAKRRHVLTFDDTVCSWKNGTSVLPLTFRQNDYYFPFRICVGKIPKKSKVTLILAVSHCDSNFDPGDIDVYVSGHRADFGQICKIETHCSRNPGYCFNIVGGDEINGYALVEIASHNKKEFTVDYIEIMIKPADEK